MTGSSRPNSLAGAGALAMLNPQIETSAFRSGGLSSPRPSRDVNDTGMEKAREIDFLIPQRLGTIASMRAREEDLP